MKHMKAVIGAGFGDEGKGFITYGESRWAEGSVLNVLYNGGVQRGHTAGGHVFHCFGSGLFAGADTFCDKHFMINPIGWLQERDQLRERLGDSFCGELFVHEFCRVTTPFDIILNQLLETARGENRHGSCGLGIWETVRRSVEYPLNASDLGKPGLYEKLRRIEREHFRPVCRMFNLTAPEYVDLEPFMLATHEMTKRMWLVNQPGQVMKAYDNVIFEGGQGLLLSDDNLFYQPNVTASSTGLRYIAKYFNEAESYMDDDEVQCEVIYVTRSYATRHGAGRFRTECPKEEINPYMFDATNQTNEWQGALRYGRLDPNEMSVFIQMDLGYLIEKPHVSLAVTQLNLTNGFAVTKDGNIPPQDMKFSCVDEVQEHYRDDLFWVRKHKGVDWARRMEGVMG